MGGQVDACFVKEGVLAGLGGCEKLGVGWDSDELCERGVVAEDGDGVFGRCEGSKGGSVMD